MSWDSSDPRKPDNSPQIEEPNRFYKKKGGKKPFVIEYRYTGEKQPWHLDSWYEWHTYKRYKTEKDRQQAFENLQAKKTNSKYPWHKRREYRVI